ncbi:MAG: alpha/beta hydrolase [Chthoniobacteraceae bacterium]
MRLLALLVLATAVHAAPLDPILLWPDKAPGALGDEDHDKPTITPYLPAPEKATGAAIVICPGGGYGGLAAHEGPGYAEYLSQQGIACFVLKYRLGSKGYRHPIMLGDAARAVRLVRSRVAEWKLDPARIGIMGSSAGGHLTTTLLTHFDAGKPNDTDPIERQSSRPDIGIVCYGVITLGEFTHQGSKKNLLGENPDPALVENLSNEKQVTKDTPPCFVWSTLEDKAVPVENSMQFVAALRRNGVPFDFHIYERGPHGIGLSQGKNGIPADDVHPWAKDLLFWLKLRGFVR